jgi:hypothetical protein
MTRTARRRRPSDLGIRELSCREARACDARGYATATQIRVAGTLALQLGAIYWEPACAILRTEPLALKDLAIVLIADSLCAQCPALD